VKEKGLRERILGMLARPFLTFRVEVTWAVITESSVGVLDGRGAERIFLGR
jgi:hypothetical protein